MQFQPFFLVSFFSLTLADYAQFATDVASYERSLAANPSVQSLFAQLSSLSPSQISQIRQAGIAFATESYGPDYWSGPPVGYSLFPTPFNSFYLSAWSAEYSLAVKDGVAGTSPATTSESSQITPASATSTATPGSSASGAAQSTSTGSSSTAAPGSSASGSTETTSPSPSGEASTETNPVTVTPSALASIPSGSSGVTSSQSAAGAASEVLAMGAVAGAMGVIAALL